MNKPTHRRRERRSKFPELSELVGLIDQARKLRLAVSELINYPPLAEPAHETVETLGNVSAKLELIADLIASAKTRPRRRRQRTESVLRDGLAAQQGQDSGSEIKRTQIASQ